MKGHEEQSDNYVKRVVLPSGKTIEVVYFQELEDTRQTAAPSAEPDQSLHVCVDCSSHLVYPVEWEESGPENWSVLLHCPNCDLYRDGVFAQCTVEAFDEELDRGSDALARDYKRLMRANLAEEIEIFSRALEADAILPDDF
jgi:hypothetical protein